MQFAQIKIFGEEGLRGVGPLGLVDKDPATAPTIFNSIISTTVGVMTVVAFIWFIIQFFIGASSMIGTGGDKGKLEEARKKIINAIIGLVVVISAIFIIDLVGDILNVNILKGPLNLPELQP